MANEYDSREKPKDGEDSIGTSWSTRPATNRTCPDEVTDIGDELRPFNEFGANVKLIFKVAPSIFSCDVFERFTNAIRSMNSSKSL